MQDNFNQTNFGQESPLFTEQSKGAGDAVPEKDTEVATPFWKRSKAWIAAGIGFIIVVLVLVIAASMMRTPEETPVSIVTPSPSPETMTQDVLDRSLEEVQERVEKAEPAKLDNPFPPIDMEIEFMTAVDDR